MSVEHSTTDNGEVILVRLDGELDLSNVPDLTGVLRDAVSPERTGLCLDLSAVRYIDSTGIRMIFALAAELEVKRQRLAIALPLDSPLRRLFAITSVDQAAAIHPTHDACLDALRDPARGSPG